jgi:protein-S-isoprenylcysteine O-methyltransferase Ste14
MSRFVVTGLLFLAAAATGFSALGQLADATRDSSLHSWAVAGYWVLKTVILAAFCVFVALRDEPRKRSRQAGAFLAVGVAVAAVVLMKEPSATSTTQVVVGDVVAFVFCAWLLAAVLALGTCFGFLPEARGLVTRGPYRLVRHPVYVGEMGTVGGFLLGAPSVWNVCVALSFCGAQLARMRMEERALAAEFPEYRQYAARTPRLFPKLARDGRRELAAWRTS